MIPDAEHTLRLYETGDYTPDMEPTLGPEDGPLVDYILDMREQRFR